MREEGSLKDNRKYTWRKDKDEVMKHNAEFGKPSATESSEYTR